MSSQSVLATCRRRRRPLPGPPPSPPLQPSEYDTLAMEVSDMLHAAWTSVLTRARHLDFPGG